MSILSWIIYIPLQTLFIPLAIPAAIWVAYRQIVVSKQLGVSQTAIEILNGRWTLHVFGIREDIATAKLANAVPNTSTFGLWVALFPLWLKAKIAGYNAIYPRLPDPGNEGLSELVTARTLYFDQIFERAIVDAEQFVLLGAGYDTRAYGKFQQNGVTYFEVDQPKVQQHKREALDNAGINCAHVQFVEVDFTQESAFEKLKAAGFDAAKRTLFLWEGVSLYLTEADVRKTIQDVSTHSPVGSALLADFYAARFTNFSKNSAMEKTLAATNEGLLFSLPFDEGHEAVLNNFAHSASMTVGATFFMGTTHKDGPYVVVSELVRG